MAGGNLSFSVALNLIADNFRRGADGVKASLRSIQYQVLGMAAALGAGGLGLSNLVSQFVQVARETNRANVALKNISGGSAQYAQNVKFLKDLASKYGQELNVLTSNYAKFSAAAQSANVSTKDQEKIFTAMSKSATAFGWSADDANLAFLAVSQMMSKGKISSEELRRQLGERLPVAMAAMAKAAGVPITELDKLLKNGELLSAEVLPKFADALESMLPNVNTDNLETSINRLKNVFIDLTSSLGIGDKYKKIIDWTREALEAIKNGTSSLVAFIVAIVVGKLGGAILGYYNKLTALRMSSIQQHERAQIQMQLATEKRIAAEKALEEAKSLFDKAKDEERVSAKKMLSRAETALERAKQREISAVQSEAELAQKASLVRSSSALGGFFATIKMGAARLVGTLRALWSSFAPMAIISAITYVITKFIQMREEAERVRNIFSDYKKEMATIGGGEEAERLRMLHKIVKERLGTENQINSARAELLRMLGLQKASEEEINKAVADRISLLEATARADFAVRKKIEFDDKNKALLNGIPISQANMDIIARQAINEMKTNGGKLPYNANTYELIRKATGLRDVMNDGSKSSTQVEFSNENRKYRQIIGILDEYVQNYRTSAEAHKDALSNEGVRLKYSKPTITPPPSPTSDDKTGKDKKTDLEKAEEEYAENIKWLKNQLDAETITREKYNEELDKQNKETHEKIGGLLGSKAKDNKTFQEAEKGVKNPLTVKESEFDKAQKEYAKKLKELENQRANGVLTEKEYSDELTDLINSTIKAVGAMDNIGAGGKEFISILKADRSAIGAMPVEGQRDTTFDYKKSDTDKLEEAYKLKEKHIEDLKKQVPDALDEIKKKEGELKTLGEQLKVAEVREDIKKLEKDLRSGVLDTTKDLINGAGRLYNAFKSISEVMENTEANGFEQLLSIFDAIFQAVDGVMSTIETIEKLTEVTKALGLAKQSQQLIENASTAKHVTNVATAAIAETAGAATTAAAKTTEVGANTAAAASSAGASAAKLPFPINLIAIGAAIAGVIALFSSIPKFAHGGIVTGGSYSGDNIIAGLNSGEMVLTTPQQGNLWRMLKNGTSSSHSGGNVEFKIKGRELVGILKQENQRNKR